MIYAKAKVKRQKTKASNRFSLFTFHFLLFTFFCLPVGPALAQKPPPDARLLEGLPKRLRSVGIDQKLNEQAPLDLSFRDEHGQSVRLGDYFGRKPVILAFVYYKCPLLCNQVLAGLASSLGVLTFDIGKEFDVVMVSFDARETPAVAAEKKGPYIERYKRDGAENGWHFLTGDQESIDALTQAAGFRYEYDPDTEQFAHASGIIILTPEGKLSRYFYGIEYAPRDVRLGLIEASDNKIGSPVDQLLLYCYHYDPATGKYGAVVMNMIRVGGVITLIGLIAMMVFLRRRGSGDERADNSGQDSGGSGQSVFYQDFNTSSPTADHRPPTTD